MITTTDRWKAEIERRSGLERRIRIDATIREMNERRHFRDRRNAIQRSRDNAFVGSWIDKFYTARARAS